MPVTSSIYTLDDRAQTDGRWYVRETHTLNSGDPFVVDYLAGVGADYAAILASRAQQINELLAEQEAIQLIET